MLGAIVRREAGVGICGTCIDARHPRGGVLEGSKVLTR
jgi:hypothetical protein